MTSTTRAALFPASLALPFVVFFTACSTSPPPAPPTQAVTTTLPSGGVYKGTLGDADATLLVLFDGTAYLFYASGGAGVGGVVIATNGSQTSDGRFASATALNYRIGAAPPSPVSFTADFAHAPAVQGAITRGNGGESQNFSGKAAPLLDTAPTLANAGGLYSGRGMALGGSTTTRITIAADGYAAGTTSAGCIFKGTLRPRPGVNAYAVSATFGPAPCPLPDATVDGSAIVDGARLLVALPSPDRSNVFIFDGRK